MANARPGSDQVAIGHPVHIIISPTSFDFCLYLLCNIAQLFQHKINYRGVREVLPPFLVFVQFLKVVFIHVAEDFVVNILEIVLLYEDYDVEPG